jgi:hypothetical protein
MDRLLWHLENDGYEPIEGERDATVHYLASRCNELAGQLRTRHAEVRRLRRRERIVKWIAGTVLLCVAAWYVGEFMVLTFMPR